MVAWSQSWSLGRSRGRGWPVAVALVAVGSVLTVIVAPVRRAIVTPLDESRLLVHEHCLLVGRAPPPRSRALLLVDEPRLLVHEHWLLVGRAPTARSRALVARWTSPDCSFTSTGCSLDEPRLLVHEHWLLVDESRLLVHEHLAARWTSPDCSSTSTGCSWTSPDCSSTSTGCSWTSTRRPAHGASCRSSPRNSLKSLRVEWFVRSAAGRCNTRRAQFRLVARFHRSASWIRRRR